MWLRNEGKMAISVDADSISPSGTVLSGSALFAPNIWDYSIP